MGAAARSGLHVIASVDTAVMVRGSPLMIAICPTTKRVPWPVPTVHPPTAGDGDAATVDPAATCSPPSQWSQRIVCESADAFDAS